MDFPATDQFHQVVSYLLEPRGAHEDAVVAGHGNNVGG